MRISFSPHLNTGIRARWIMLLRSGLPGDGSLCHMEKAQPHCHGECGVVVGKAEGWRWSIRVLWATTGNSLDFIRVAFSFFLPLPSSSFFFFLLLPSSSFFSFFLLLPSSSSFFFFLLPSFLPLPTSDRNCERISTVTSTWLATSSRSQSTLPDLNRELQIWLGTAGPQLVWGPEISGHCRTLIAR